MKTKSRMKFKNIKLGTKEARAEINNLVSKGWIIRETSPFSVTLSYGKSDKY